MNAAKSPASRLGLGVLVALTPLVAWAHGPVFAQSPHVIYQGGYEVHAGFDNDKTGERADTTYELRFGYGLTGDWTAGLEMDYGQMSEPGAVTSGFGDAALFTKYRFWRQDLPGVQNSAAVFLEQFLDTGARAAGPPLANEGKSTIAGLAYGHESLKWYWWADARYRYNGRNRFGLRPGDRTFVDLVGGWRPTPPSYYRPDLVWMLELNWEHTERDNLAGVALPDSGGTELFLSPGLMWTYRNFAIKPGIQFPLYHHMNGAAPKSAYRVRVEFEWHL